VAIGVYFVPASLTAQQYDGAITRLEAAGAGKPAGRSYHTCFGEPNKLAVFEVWDSMASLERFGQTLMPILAEIGIDPDLRASCRFTTSSTGDVSRIARRPPSPRRACQRSIGLATCS